MKHIIILLTTSFVVFCFSTRDAVSQENSVYEAWVARYNGPGNGTDAATALAADDSGNVYVTGYSSGSGTSFDYATIKYDASGVEQWVARYNGPGNGIDQASALAVDGSGNVYVTGLSNGSVTSWDYATIKYDASGVEQWVARYNGPGNSDDQANSVAVDGSGNVCVTGYSTGLGTSSDYTTIKYNAYGVEQWIQRYNGPGNSDDVGYALALDRRANVCVTGGSYGSGTSSDYATIKYDSSGSELWVARHNSPSDQFEASYAIAVDASGNVYVTGSGGLDSYFLTLKYDASGEKKWMARYSQEGNDDIARSLAVDESGNVYVAGTGQSNHGSSSDHVTIMYDASGDQKWVAAYDAGNFASSTSIAVDGSGNVYVAGNSGSPPDFATTKYDSSGLQQWLANYNGGRNSYDDAGAIAVDSSGNVYVAGFSNGDYVTIKYRQSQLPTQVLLRSPVGGAVISTDSVIFFWRAGFPRVDRYWFEISRDSLFVGARIDSALTDTVTIVYELEHNQTYWWKVRAHNSYGWGPFSEVGRFFVYQEIPPSPTLLSPDSGATRVSTAPTLTWSSSPGTEYYTLQLSDTLDFSRLTVEEDNIDVTSFEVTGLSINTTYYWRVNATNALGTSLWSNVWSFTTFLPLPAEVILVSPVNGATILEDSVHVLWRLSAPEIDRYWFEWAGDSLFTDAWIDSTEADTISIASPLLSNQTYFWKVRAHNETGWGPFSEVWSFSVLITSSGAQNEIPVVFSLSQNHPNPFNPSTTIKYALPQKAHVKLEVFNMLGQSVAVLVNSEQEAGYHSVVFESGGLASGVYIYRLTANTFVRTKRLLLLR